jgi:hypothetical protein
MFWNAYQFHTMLYIPVNEAIIGAAKNGIRSVVQYIDDQQWFNRTNDGTICYKIPFSEWIVKTGVTDIDKLNRVINDTDDNYFAVEEGGDGDSVIYLYIVAEHETR